MKKSIDWPSILKLWEGSTQSKAEFCAQHHVPYTNFCKRTSAHRVPKMGLVPVRTKPEPSALPILRSHYWTFEFPKDATPEYVGKLLRALGGNHA